MFKLIVNAHGNTVDDLVSALNEAARNVEKECVEGADSNDEGGYFFKRTGEEEKE